MDYKELSFAVRLLDPLTDQAPIRVQRKTFKRFSGEQEMRLLDLFFGDKDEVYLTRNNVFSRVRRNKDLFAISVLLWGFPKLGLLNYDTIFSNWSKIKRFAQRITKTPNLSIKEYTLLMKSSPKGLGMTALSKLLYFAGCSIEGKRCVILDSRVVKGIQKLEGNEFSSLQQLSGATHKYEIYPKYLDALWKLANGMKNIEAKPEEIMARIEFSLWLYGMKY